MGMPVAQGRRIQVAFLAILLIAVAGCSSDASGESAEAEAGGNGRLQVVATMSIFADFARAVGGEHVDVTSIVPIGGDPHVYEPRPSDSRLITDADVVLANGLGLSPWFEPLRVNARGEVVELTASLTAAVIESDERPDPHLWMVPDFVANGYVAAVEVTFAAADPAHASEFAENADRYRERLTELDAEISGILADVVPDRRKLVTSHDAYGYFADAYGFEVVGTVLGVSTEDEPTAQNLQRLIDLIREIGVPAIFLETTTNPSVMERVATDAGVALGTPLYGDSLGEPGSGADTYVGMMVANATSIAAGLAGTR